MNRLQKVKTSLTDQTLSTLARGVTKTVRDASGAHRPVKATPFQLRDVSVDFAFFARGACAQER